MPTYGKKVCGTFSVLIYDYGGGVLATRVKRMLVGNQKSLGPLFLPCGAVRATPTVSSRMGCVQSIVYNLSTIADGWWSLIANKAKQPGAQNRQHV